MTTSPFPQIRYRIWWIFISYLWFLTYTFGLLYLFSLNFDFETVEIFGAIMLSFIWITFLMGLLKILMMPKIVIENNRFEIRGWRKEYLPFKDVKIEEAVGRLDGRPKLRLVGKKKTFPIHKSYVKNFDEIKNTFAEQLGLEYSPRSAEKRRSIFKTILICSAIFIVIFWCKDSINSLKYHLPIPAIETVEIEGILSKKIKTYKAGQPTKLYLEEFPFSTFRYSDLKNTIYTEQADLAIPVGSKVRLKIRKSDLARLQLPAEQRTRKRLDLHDEDHFYFYELEYDEKIILQKCCTRMSKI